MAAVPGVQAADSIGAGDSFDAGYIAGFLEGADTRTCLALGNACGALSTRGVGGTASQATRAEADALARVLVTGRAGP